MDSAVRNRNGSEISDFHKPNLRQAPIRWIFFDLGSTLVDEEEAYRHRIRDMIHGKPITFEQVWEKRIEAAKAGYNGDQKVIEYFGLTKTPWHSEDETLFPDAASTLAVLKERSFRLGLIANQNPGTKERLANWGLLRFFDVIAASAELGHAKPDPEIFRWALAQAGCAQKQAVMVGDRLDNDIRPAKELGMTTIRVQKGLAVYMHPSCAAEVPDYTVESLSEILQFV